MKLSASWLACLISIPLALAQTEFIRDGSIEKIPASDEGETNFEAGSWKFSDLATMMRVSSGSTPYGKQYVISVKPFGDKVRRGQITQKIAGLTIGETYSLSYVVGSMGDTHEPCTLSSYLGSQLLDTFDLPQDLASNLVHTTTFTPDTTGGIFKMLFTGHDKHWFFTLDNVSVTGP